MRKLSPFRPLGAAEQERKQPVRHPDSKASSSQLSCLTPVLVPWTLKDNEEDGHRPDEERADISWCQGIPMSKVKPQSPPYSPRIRFQRKK